MRVLYILCCMFIILILCGLVYSYIKDCLPTNKNLKYIIFCSVAVISLISIYIIPNEVYDLFRHHQMIDDLRNGGYGLNTEYDNLFLIKGLFYLVALTGHSELIQLVSCVIFYSVFAYILYDYYKCNTLKARQFVTIVCVFFAMISYIDVYSQVRNPIAYALFSLAIYRDFYRNKKTLVTVLLYISPLFIHYSLVLLVFIRIAYIFKDKWFRYRYIIISWSFLVPILIMVAEKTSIKYLVLMADQIKNYVFHYLGDIRLLIINYIFVLCLFVIVEYCLRKKLVNDKNLEVVRFLDVIIGVSLSCFAVPNIFTRMMYVFGMFLPIIFNLISEKILLKQKYNTIFNGCCLAYCIGMFSYQIVAFLNNGLMIL